MTNSRRFFAVAALVAMAGVPLFLVQAVAQQLSDREKQIGGKFMCMCGCSQVLTQCNHVGCMTSAAMLKELSDSVRGGKSEDAITQMLVQEFGTKVYAEPPKSGFSLVAWAMPTVYLVIGTVLVVFVISRWRKPAVHKVAPAGNAPEVSSELLERARAQAARETED
ncbi:MAG TPA: cytochrome c-type biogenesis protein CcmH [Candidatus Udaeobacter sp.]|jgi:cytochrome c-type biogenesis protein CcmH|nr:cytochrome c-type biogenesis protein CcmH [Candidatus Udaeobacter sp.]